MYGAAGRIKASIRCCNLNAFVFPWLRGQDGDRSAGNVPLQERIANAVFIFRTLEFSHQRNLSRLRIRFSMAPVIVEMKRRSRRKTSAVRLMPACRGTLLLPA